MARRGRAVEGGHHEMGEYKTGTDHHDCGRETYRESKNEAKHEAREVKQRGGFPKGDE